jgi:hypothetical protein
MNNKKQQQGQAIVEMCAGIIAIMAIFMGIIFVGGIGITNIQTLLGNKSATETTSRTTSQGGQGSNIYAWDYGDQANSNPEVDEFQGHRLFHNSTRRDALAFTRDDLIITNSNQADAFSATRNSILYSYLHIQLPEDNKLLNTVTSDSGSNSFYFLGAANLVSSQGTTGNTIFTLKKQDAATATGMKQTFTSLFGVNANVNFQDISNQVYYPATGSPGGN